MNIKINEKTKLILSIIIVSSILFSNKASAQQEVIIKDVNPDSTTPTLIKGVSPQVRFWVTNFESTTSSSTIFTKDEMLIEIANKQFIEQQRHNKWLEDFTKVGAQTDKELARDLANKLLEETDKKIIDFAKEGFNKGEGEEGTGDPAYTDQQDYLRKAELTETGIMVANDFKSEDICEEVKKEVKKVIGKEGIDPNLQKKLKCTNENDGSNPKNWEDWVVLVQPENNPMGALVIANNELAIRKEEKKQTIINELDQGKGSLSYKKCQKMKVDDEGEETEEGEPFYGDPIYEQDLPEDTKTTEIEEDADGYFKTVCVTVTPGSIIDSSIQLQSQTLSETSAIESSLSDGTTLVKEELTKKLLEKVDLQFEKGLLDETDEKLSEEIQNILEDDANNMAKASTTSINPFPPTDIYNTGNDVSPYKQKTWFSKWGIGDIFDIINMLSGYDIFEPSTPKEPDCPPGQVRSVFGTCH